MYSNGSQSRGLGWLILWFGWKCHSISTLKGEKDAMATPCTNTQPCIYPSSDHPLGTSIRDWKLYLSVSTSFPEALAASSMPLWLPCSSVKVSLMSRRWRMVYGVIHGQSKRMQSPPLNRRYASRPYPKPPVFPFPSSQPNRILQEL